MQDYRHLLRQLQHQIGLAVGEYILSASSLIFFFHNPPDQFYFMWMVQVKFKGAKDNLIQKGHFVLFK